ncbi:MAG: ABC transporter permease [Acidithiobacillus sp.]
MASSLSTTECAHSGRRSERFGLGFVLTVAPGALWIILFLLAPSILVIAMAFLSNGDYGSPHLPMTLDAFRRVLGFSVLGWSNGNLMTLWRSLVQSATATVATILVAYPLAFFIVSRRSYLRPLLLLMVILPSWTNQVIRTYAWMELLAPDTSLSHLAQESGLIAPHMGLFPSDFAIFLGLIYNYLPYMVLPLYAAVEKLDWTIVEAGRDLYASGYRLFWHTVFPQTLPGLLAGIILVAIPAFGNFVVPQMLGGNKFLMLGNLIANQFTSTPDWPYGAALALVMLCFTFAGLFAFRRVARRMGREEGQIL